MRTTLFIVTDQADSVVAVPHSAVLGGAGRLFAFVQDDAEGLIYDKRAVVVGMKDDRYSEIIEGVFPGDKVVTEGNYQLQYVTTKPKDPKSQGKDSATSAAPAPPSALAGEARGKPLYWIGGTIAVLLLANLIAMLLKKRATAQTEPTAPVSVTNEVEGRTKAVSVK